MRRAAPSLAALAGLLALLAAGTGAEVVLLPPPGAPPWRGAALRGVERQTAYARVVADGAPALRAESRCAASAQVLPADGIDLRRTPVLSWRWRVERGPDVPDEQRRAGDDFAARVYATFELEPGRATLLERLWHRLAESFYGEEVPGSAVSWVWTGRTEPGRRWESPYTPSARLVALRRGAPGDWQTERVHVPRAYREAFGRDPPPLRGIALMSDADNSCQEAVAFYADFRLLGEAEAAAEGPLSPPP
jgi:hypothetical protein